MDPAALTGLSFLALVLANVLSSAVPEWVGTYGEPQLSQRGKRWRDGDAWKGCLEDRGYIEDVKGITN